MKTFNKINAPLRLQKWAFIGGIVLFALLVFYPLLTPNSCLFTTDDNLGMMASIKEVFPAQFWGQWGDQMLCGLPGGRGMISWTPIMMGMLPALFAFNWIHAIDLVLASIFLFFFLRANNVSRPAIALGILTAFWLGSNFTLIYAGHIPKFGILMLAAAFLVCIRKVRYNADDWLWCVIAGGIMGLMFIEQQDVALFFGIFLGFYAVFQLVRVYFPQLITGQTIQNNQQRNGRISFQILRVFLLLLIVPTIALLVSFTTLAGSYTSQIKSVSQSDEQTDKQAKWEFATQWSWPPEESIDFIAPGYMGWRSGEPGGPYWGRMGRSAGWEQTGRGFMNFKLENQYLGAIPVIFALFAVLIVCLRSDFRNPFSSLPEDAQMERAGTAVFDLKCARAEVLFWFFVALITLLLSFGKYFPLYQLFYQLPVVSNIRNPNKFLQVFQLAVGILAAYGAHLAFCWHETCRRKGN